VTEGFLDPRVRRGLLDRAVAHFNARRFWEAHEDWEAVWHEEEDPKRRWIQGLIQVAAALFHFERGFHASGFWRLLEAAEQKVSGYAADTDGIRFDLLLRDLLPWFEHGRAVRSGRGLRDAAPALPTIRHADGFVPAPLPDDEFHAS
jgi:predicted metal-dependent hydrolase